jgi:hypothetical protein
MNLIIQNSISCDDFVSISECNEISENIISGGCFWIEKNGSNPEKQCINKVLCEWYIY